MDYDEYLTIIGDSYKGIHESTVAIRESTRGIEATQRLALQLLARSQWMQTFALALLGLALVGIGLLGWFAITTHHEHAALLQALTVQTRALEQRLHERSP